MYRGRLGRRYEDNHPSTLRARRRRYIVKAQSMKLLGKILELVGMVIVLGGFLYGVQYSLVRFELGALAIGSLIFYIGWLIERNHR